MLHVSNYRLKFGMWINIKEDFFFSKDMKHELKMEQGEPNLPLQASKQHFPNFNFCKVTENEAWKKLIFEV